MSEEGSSLLGIISLISALIAAFLMILVGSYALILAPIAIITGLAGTATDNHRFYGIFGFFLGIFLILYFFFGNTPLFS